MPDVGTYRSNIVTATPSPGVVTCGAAFDLTLQLDAPGLVTIDTDRRDVLVSPGSGWPYTFTATVTTPVLSIGTSEVSEEVQATVAGGSVTVQPE